VEAWPFVGRDEELRFIAAACRETGVSGVVVVGDAGVGKTRLAREALTRLAAPGRRVEWVRATRSAAAIPLGAVSHLLPPDCPDDGGLGAFLRAVRHFSANSGRRIVLAVDDAHLLDHPSAALVHYLAVRQLAYVLVTVRSGEDTPDAVAALWRENLTARLDLGPLESRALDEIIDHALDGVLDTVSRRELHRICAGNPLLLRELLQAGAETSALREQAGLWRWTGGLPVTTRLTEVVATRLDTAPDDVGDALEVIACGEPLPLDLLDRLVGPDVAAAAERTGLMTSEQSHRRVLTRLAHPLYAEIIRARLTPARVRRIWDRIATAMADNPMRRRDDCLFAGLAHLRAQRRTDPDLLLTAARRAYARADLDLAETLARAAQEAGGGWQADQLRAEALDRNGQYKEAARVLPQPPADDDVAHVRWAVTRAHVLYWGFAQTDLAEQILLDAGNRPGQDAANATRSWILLFDGRCQDSITAADTVLTRDGAEPETIVPAAAGATMAATMLGRFDYALTTYERGMAALRRCAEPPWGATMLGVAGCLRHLFSGSAHQAWLLADGQFQSNVDQGVDKAVSIWSLYRGVVARFQSDLVRAATALREAAALLESTDPFQLLRICFPELATVAALSGDAAGAAGWLERADNRQREAGRLYQPWTELNRAWASHDQPARSGQAGALRRRARPRQPTTNHGDGRALRRRPARRRRRGPPTPHQAQQHHRGTSPLCNGPGRQCTGRRRRRRAGPCDYRLRLIRIPPARRQDRHRRGPCPPPHRPTSPCDQIPGTSRRPRRYLPESQHPAAQPRRSARRAHPPRAGDRPPGGSRPIQPGHRAHTPTVHPYRQQPPRPCLRQTQRFRPPRTHLNTRTPYAPTLIRSNRRQGCRQLYDDAATAGGRTKPPRPATVAPIGR